MARDDARQVVHRPLGGRVLAGRDGFGVGARREAQEVGLDAAGAGVAAGVGVNRQEQVGALRGWRWPCAARAARRRRCGGSAPRRGPAPSASSRSSRSAMSSDDVGFLVPLAMRARIVAAVAGVDDDARDAEPELTGQREGAVGVGGRHRGQRRLRVVGGPAAATAGAGSRTGVGAVARARTTAAAAALAAGAAAAAPARDRRRRRRCDRGRRGRRRAGAGHDRVVGEQHWRFGRHRHLDDGAAPPLGVDHHAERVVEREDADPGRRRRDRAPPGSRRAGGRRAPGARRRRRPTPCRPATAPRSRRAGR